MFLVAILHQINEQEIAEMWRKSNKIFQTT